MAFLGDSITAFGRRCKGGYVKLIVDGIEIRKQEDEARP